jgi:hypothetical protein
MSERDDELEATAAERAEAEALARALERDGAKDAGPEDAVSAAALLRAAAAPGPDARIDRAGSRARAAVDARRPRRRWLLLALLAPAAAAAAVALLFRSSPEYSARLSSRGMPAPSAALLEAQARAARGRPDLAALDAEMRGFRAAYYAALAEERP